MTFPFSHWAGSLASRTLKWCSAYSSSSRLQRCHPSRPLPAGAPSTALMHGVPRVAATVQDGRLAVQPGGEVLRLKPQLGKVMVNAQQRVADILKRMDQVRLALQLLTASRRAFHRSCFFAIPSPPNALNTYRTDHPA